MLHHDLYYSNLESFFIELKAANLIDNYYWFFNFDEFIPLKKKIKGQFIIGGLPHVIFPKKYSLDNFETTNSAEISFTVRDWRLIANKIYINNNMELNNEILILKYEIYNIIPSNKFHIEIKNLFMDELIKEKKCFFSNFSQNLFNNYNLTFYYCNKSIKNIL